MTPVIQVGGGALGGGLSHAADCNVYLVRAGGRAVLIDAGSGLGPEQLADNVRAAGVEPDRVEAVLLTHAHLDHSGGAAWLAARGRVLVSTVPDCSPFEQERSLRRLAALPIGGLYPGHGPAVARGGCDHVRAAVPHLDRLLLPPNLLPTEGA
jgi:glyoxylase-like metal-dependent hydrolase (beta-lactamase superfamily II)